MPTTIACISDTHGYHDEVVIPECDILIHSGDATGRGSLHEIDKFAKWFNEQPARYKVFVAGNHDFEFEKHKELAVKVLTYKTDIIYLEGEDVVIEGLKIWGGPWQPYFCNWAFNVHRYTGELKEIWSRIPNDADIVVTHGPPYGVNDKAFRGGKCGCNDLLVALDRVQPMVHVSGHIHEGYGWNYFNNILCINASTCTLAYNPDNPAVVVKIVDKEVVDCYSHIEEEDE